MVCRENKGRSSIIGLTKALHRINGGVPFHDAEVQSSQHEFKHELEALNAAYHASPKDWKKAQIEAWESMRSQIVDNPDLSEAAKYRISHGRGGQPGLVTRIDQELERLHTGKNEDGTPLRPEQRNTPAELASIIRIGSIQERIAPAKENFLEMNARHRGIPMSEARSEWNALMNRKGDFSNISLRDDYRDSLASAGMTAEDQATLGQSGRARDSMQIMENRRIAAIGKLEKRDALVPEKHRRRSYLDPASEAAKVRCDQCGQFGHEGGDCPNGDLTKKQAVLNGRQQALHAQVRAARHQELADKSDQDVAALLTAKGEPADAKNIEAFRTRQQLLANDQLDGQPAMSAEQLRTEQRGLEREQNALKRSLADRGGEVSWIQSLDYNPENGLMVVTTHPKVRKDGTVGEPSRMVRRASPETVKSLLDDPRGLGKALNEQGLVRGSQLTNYDFENEEDLKEALVQRRCPTCGQFASMNTGHRCVVKGGPSEEQKARNIAESAATRELLLQSKGVEPGQGSSRMQTRAAFQLETGAIKIRGADGQALEGHAKYGSRDRVIDAVDAGDVAVTTVSASYPDGTVSGTVAVWEDIDAQRVMSINGAGGSTGLKCSCAVYAKAGYCHHVRGTATSVARQYKATNARQSVPGGASLADNAAVDAPLGSESRLSYADIRKLQNSETGDFVQMLAARPTNGVPLSAPAAMPPRDTDGNPVAEPSEWRRNPAATSRTGKPVDLTNASDTAWRLRRALSGREGRREWSVKQDRAGGIYINVPKKVAGTPAEGEARAQLQTLLDTPEKVTGKGFYIPPTPSARHAALDRAFGDKTRIRPSQWVTNLDPERIEANRARRAQTQGRNAGDNDALRGQRTQV